MSDPHYAGPLERLRPNHELQGLANPLVRLLIRIWRSAVWLRDPFAHNYLLDDFIAAAGKPDLVVANGDFSCDTGFIGLADPAARQSAEECISKLRAPFGRSLRLVMGDHELGKISLAGNRGGMRVESWRISTQDIEIAPVWEERIGNHVLIGVTSSLIALDLFHSDILPEELRAWQQLRAEHLQCLREIFERTKSTDRIILFCHDPAALPFLAMEKFVEKRLPQFDRTIIGHLHTPMIFWKSKILAGFPPVSFFGKGVRRITRALQRARSWKPFNVMLCPSLAGSQLLKDGGYLSLQISEGASAKFARHHLRWR